MTLPSIENFDISFIVRTAKNLRHYEGEFEFTMLLNSLLGLICVPKEQQLKRYFPVNRLKTKIKDVKLVGDILKQGKEDLIKENQLVKQRKFFWMSDGDNEISYNEIEVYDLLSRMRHSIAHFGVIPVASPDKKSDWYGVILQILGTIK